MSNPTWTDIFTADELADVLDMHSLQLAKRFGEYSIAADIKYAAECIRDLSERIVQAEAEAIRIRAMTEKVEATAYRAMAALESLSKVPP